MARRNRPTTRSWPFNPCQSDTSPSYEESRVWSMSDRRRRVHALTTESRAARRPAESTAQPLPFGEWAHITDSVMARRTSEWPRRQPRMRPVTCDRTTSERHRWRTDMPHRGNTKGHSLAQASDRSEPAALCGRRSYIRRPQHAFRFRRRSCRRSTLSRTGRSSRPTEHMTLVSWIPFFDCDSCPREGTNAQTCTFTVTPEIASHYDRIYCGAGWKQGTTAQIGH